MRRFKAVRGALQAAEAQSNAQALKVAKAELDALVLFKTDMGAYLRLYTFLSQIFNYESTAIEKRALVYKRLLPLLEFGRERESIDLSKVKLTHHTLKARAPAAMVLGVGEKPLLYPLTETGGGSVQDKERARLREIIERVNALFGGETSEQDTLVYVESVRGKLLESSVLVEQAANNTKEQFGGSPDLRTELVNAIISALVTHTQLSQQALGSEPLQVKLLEVLLTHGLLWESLRAKAPENPAR